MLIDFRKYKVGTKIELRNLSNKNNVDFANTGKVMQFEVVDDTAPKDTYVIPATLDLGPQPCANRGAIEVNKLTPSMAKARRSLRVERKNGIWTINGETWEDVEATNFQRVLGNPAAVRRGDLGPRQQVRRLVPPAAHPPDRRQDHRAEHDVGRQGARRGRAAARTSSTSARTRR